MCFRSAVIGRRAWRVAAAALALLAINTDATVIALPVCGSPSKRAPKDSALEAKGAASNAAGCSSVGSRAPINDSAAQGQRGHHHHRQARGLGERRITRQNQGDGQHRAQDREQQQHAADVDRARLRSPLTQRTGQRGRLSFEIEGWQRSRLRSSPQLAARVERARLRAQTRLLARERFGAGRRGGSNAHAQVFVVWGAAAAAACRSRSCRSGRGKTGCKNSESDRARGPRAPRAKDRPGCRTWRRRRVCRRECRVRVRPDPLLSLSAETSVF